MAHIWCRWGPLVVAVAVFLASPVFRGHSGTFWCPDYSTTNCPVGHGNFQYDSVAGDPLACTYTCDRCYSGTYKGVENKDSCYPCPSGTDSGYEATVCVASTCGPGYYKSGSDCLPCGVNKYKSGTNSATSCSSCRLSTTTGSSTTASSCYAVTCGSGYKRSNRSCLVCGVNYYKSGTTTATSCSACDRDSTTLGSTTASSCTDVTCTSGHYRTGRSCYSCGLDKHKSGTNTNTSCSTCGVGYSTFGVTTASSCTAVTCASGYRVNDKDCTACGINMYKSGTTTARSCSACAAGYWTNGGTTSSSCSLFTCPAGHYKSGLSCYECGSNKYKAGNNGDTSCSSCSSSTSTFGDTTASSCTAVTCGPGYRRSGRSCVACGVNYYKVGTTTSDTCTACSTSTTTGTNTIATSCYAVTCGSGYYRSGRSCYACGEDNYKSGVTTATSCSSCSLSTSTFGDTTASSCATVTCTEGHYRVNRDCAICGVDSYKAGTNTNTSCNSCTGGRTTNSLTARTTENSCGCVKGYTANGSTSSSCSACPADSFKNTHGNESCTSCRGNSGAGEASTSVGACTCRPGYYQSVSLPAACSLCPANTYKANYGDIGSLCVSCGVGLSSSEGSTAATDCKAVAGFFVNGSGDSEICPLGEYREGLAHATSCISCPHGKTTQSTGSTTAGLCACQAGEYLPSGGICTSCESGTYQTSFSSPSSCTPCHVDSSTSKLGSTAASDCTCDPGFFLSSPSTCRVCPGDTYKGESGNSAVLCLNCGTFLEILDSDRNLAGGAIEETSCYAPAGYEYDPSTDNGIACALNHYRGGGLSRANACLACPDGRQTESTATISEDLCLCPAGQKARAGGCVDCGAGSFRAGFGSSCTPCPAGATTISTTATLESECICSPGYTYSSDIGGCVICGANSWKSTPSDSDSCTSCNTGLSSSPGSTSIGDCLAPMGSFVNEDNAVEACGDNLITLGEGSISETDCLAPNGFEYNPVSKKGDSCPGGWYRSTGNTRTLLCLQCSGGRTTEDGVTGSDSEGDCGCVAGEGWDSTLGVCEICGGAEFSDLFGMFPCSGCAAGATTNGTGIAVSSTDCKCPEGLEWDSGLVGSLCVICGDGYFSSHWGDEPCSSCSSFSSHNTAHTSCECSPGYTLDVASVRFLCQECSADTYKSTQGNGACVACGDYVAASTTNGSSGADSAAFCECPAGTELSDSSCHNCRLGLFKAAWGDSTTCIETSVGHVPKPEGDGELPCSPGFFAPKLSDPEFSAAEFVCQACPENQSSDGAAAAEHCYECPGSSERNSNGLCECHAGYGGPTCEVCVRFLPEGDLGEAYNFITSTTLSGNSTHTPTSSTYSGSEAGLAFPNCTPCEAGYGSVDGITCLKEDCAGTPAGAVEVDNCGVCGGDSSLCESSSVLGSVFSVATDPTSPVGISTYAGFAVIFLILGLLIFKRRRASRKPKGSFMEAVTVGTDIEFGTDDFISSELDAGSTISGDFTSPDNEGALAVTQTSGGVSGDATELNSANEFTQVSSCTAPMSTKGFGLEYGTTVGCLDQENW